jgi:hypothetical protein
MTSNAHTIRVPFCGMVLHADCTLVQAFMEQSDIIGWEHFLRGRISTKWGKVYQSFKSRPHQEPTNATPWATRVIIALWTYSTNLWKFRMVSNTDTQRQRLSKKTSPTYNTKLPVNIPYTRKIPL